MKLALLCPGQGGQHPTMFDPLAHEPAAGAVLGAFRGAGFDPLASARDETRFRNAIAQPLLCAYQVAAWAALRDHLPVPTLAAGYSVGELAAYGCAGAIAPAALLALAHARAAAMDACATPPSGLMAVRGVTLARLEALCDRYGVAIAIYVAAAHAIIGGPRAALAALQYDPGLHRGDVHLNPLPVDVAAHTRWLAAAVTPFAAALAAAPFGAPAFPVLAGIDGRMINDTGAAREALARQLAEPVRWSDCLDVAFERGCRVFIELGACDALSRMVRERFDSVQARSLADFSEPGALVAWARRALEA